MGAPPRLARVIIDLALDRHFDYRIPLKLARKIHIGSRVLVSFRHTTRHAYVVALPPYSPVARDKLKDILEIDGSKSLFSPSLLKLGEWMADYYCCPREQAILAMLPAVVRTGKTGHKTKKVVSFAPDINPAEALEKISPRATAQAKLIKTLAHCHSASLSFLTGNVKISSSAIHALAQQNIVVIEDENEDRDPFSGVRLLPSTPLPLNREQQASLDLIEDSLKATRRKVILLHGVTGSGKTEVYLQAIQKHLDRGEDTIVLVPEIALTPQTTERFRARFGERVSVLHSRLSDGERFDAWTKIHEGKVKIVVGARSALFAPFGKLGLIVVDEEHETSYKQDRAPRYQARDVAVMRGKMENATVILGSATPALESLYNVELGKYTLSKLTQRVDNQRMPILEYVDMGAEAAACGQPQILSRQLISAIRGVLDEGEQVMLFLNRRGYATQMQCLQCGYVAECEDCSTALTYHRRDAMLLCHLCGNLCRAPEICPKCQDANIRYFGLGTQKVERLVGGLFPDARTLRMDADTMTRKHSYREALTAFRSGSVDILIGTQMIAKGLHFPNVTLVGVVFADLSLNLPDFRAGERTFQLIVQVAGRAGRGEVPGRVLVQTYTPFHPVIQAALTQNYDNFYQTEMVSRKDLHFPPCSRMLMLRFQGEDEDLVRSSAEKFAEFILPRLPATTKLIPPMPCAIARKRRLYRYQILLTTDKIVALSRGVRAWLQAAPCPRDVRINVDVDPLSVL